MQVMFFRQHFGSLAIGLSNADVALRIARRSFAKQDRQFRHDFFSVDAGGINHPWKPTSRSGKDDYAIRVAIIGEDIIFDEDSPMSSSTARLYAKVEWNVNCEVYLEYRFADHLISDGIADPSQLAATITKTAVDHVNKKVHPNANPKWIVVDKPQIPRKVRSLLGKVMSRVQSAIGQGADFFQDPKYR